MSKWCCENVSLCTTITIWIPYLTGNFYAAEGDLCITVHLQANISVKVLECFWRDVLQLFPFQRE